MKIKILEVKIEKIPSRGPVSPPYDELLVQIDVKYECGGKVGSVGAPFAEVRDEQDVLMLIGRDVRRRLGERERSRGQILKSLKELEGREFEI